MARVALTVIGGVIGGAVGVPGLGSYLGSALGGYIERKDTDPIVQEGPRLDDLHVQTSAYGVPIFQLWGTMRLAGNIIWSAPITEVKTANSTSQGKGSPTQVAIRYTYFATFAVALCEGPVDRIFRIWADADLIYNTTPTNENVIAGLGEINFTLYEGTESQTADPTIQAEEGVNHTPAYRGLAYVVFTDFPLEKFGNRIPNFSFDISTQAVSEVDYSELFELDDQTELTKDHIVFSPDNMHVIIQQACYWRRINIIDGTIVKEAYHGTSDWIPARNSAPTSPTLATVHFDIDERGIIHTMKGDANSTMKMCQLDSTTLAFIKEASANLPETYFYTRVFRNPSYPYVVVIPSGAGNSKLYIINRDTHAVTDSTYGGITNASMYWRMIDLDHDNGIIYVLKTFTDGHSQDRVIKIQIGTDGIIINESLIGTNTDCPKANLLTFDLESSQVIVGSTGEGKIAFFDSESPFDNLGTMLATFDSIYNMRSAWRRGVQNGYLYHAVSDVVHRIDISSYTSDREWSLNDSTISWNGGSCYDPLTHSMIIGADVGGTLGFIKMLLDRSGATMTLLSTVVSNICATVGLSADDIDVAELTDLIYGFAVNDQMRARAAIQVLMDAYFFDAIESDGKINFIKRGGSSVVSIPEVNLAAHISSSERPQKLITQRQEELTLPREVRLTYIDPSTNYLVGVQRECRLITVSENIFDVKLPMAMETDAAKQACEKHLANAWMQRTRHTLIVPRQYVYLNSGDVITVTENGNTHIVRIEEMSHGAGIITLKVVNENASVYESEAVGAELPTPDELEVDYPGATELVILDIPLLQSSHNFVGVYVATQGYTTNWRGAIIERSGVGGTLTWESFVSTTKDAIVGRASNALGDAPDPFIWDVGNIVNIQLLDSEDTLSSVTEDQVIGGYNIGLLGNEIIQWQNATLEGDGSYTLSKLLRGRKGSDYATWYHSVGDKFIVIDMSKLVFVLMNLEDKDQSIQFRTTSVGMSATTAITMAQVISINNIKPLSPQHISGVRDGSDNLTISWIPRTRIMGEWRDLYGVDLGETAEMYEVDIYDGSILVRTITGLTSAETTYTAAQQTIDFGSPQSSIDIEVFQLSSVFSGAAGRGFETEATV